MTCTKEASSTKSWKGKAANNRACTFCFWRRGIIIIIKHKKGPLSFKLMRTRAQNHTFPTLLKSVIKWPRFISSRPHVGNVCKKSWERKDYWSCAALNMKRVFLSCLRHRHKRHIYLYAGLGSRWTAIHNDWCHRNLAGKMIKEPTIHYNGLRSWDSFWDKKLHQARTLISLSH